ncbi:MAG: hypothetical protein KTR31_32345 [Myxococcales bacterium]|nr:hypothetical protein [Myxococcales bacterium]
MRMVVGLSILAMCGVASQAHAGKKTNVKKLIGEVEQIVDKEQWRKCHTKVDLGLGAAKINDEQKARLMELGYYCALSEPDLARADALRTDEAQAGPTVKHAYLYMNEGRHADALSLVEGLEGVEAPLDLEVADIQVQTLALVGRLDDSLALVREGAGRPPAKLIVADALLVQRRLEDAKLVLADTCGSLQGQDAEACTQRVASAESLETLMAMERPEGAPESLPATAVHFVDFTTKDGTFAGGHAFAVQHGGTDVAITALHLFGPRMGLPNQLPSSELGSALQAVTFPHAALLTAWEVDRALEVEGAEVTGQMSASDVALFALAPSGGVQADRLPLAETGAEEDDKLWVVGPRIVADAPERYLHPASVRQVGADGLVEIRFDSAVSLNALSGAPAVNADGQVVGMALGGGMAGPMHIGVLVPASALQEHIEGSLQ